MAHSPLTLSRRHVLGKLYDRCDRLGSVPVFWNDPLGARLGFVDDSPGDYADAFTFHLSEEICKKLAAGQVLCTINYEFTDETVVVGSTRSKRRIKVTSFLLKKRESYEKPARFAVVG